MEAPAFGPLLRDWRHRRRLSQLDLALEADISPRHMSFVETGRSRPSRDVVLRLADSLSLTLRNRNSLLVAAGFAPANAERPLDDPDLAAARAIIQRILDAHMPFPALAIDRHWDLLANNGAVAALMAGASPVLLAPPVNVLRLSLHPDGLAPQIANLAQWKRHLIERLDQQVAVSGDAQLEALRDELAGYPAPASATPPAVGFGDRSAAIVRHPARPIVVPFDHHNVRDAGRSDAVGSGDRDLLPRRYRDCGTPARARLKICSCVPQRIDYNCNR